LEEEIHQQQRGGKARKKVIMKKSFKKGMNSLRENVGKGLCILRWGGEHQLWGYRRNGNMRGKNGMLYWGV